MNIQSKSLFKLQQILFPVEDICNEEEMYFKGIGIYVDGQRVKFSKGGVLSASTYFNSFSLHKWKCYTGLNNIKLLINLIGDFEICLCSMRLQNGNAVKTVHSKIQVSANGITSFDMPDADNSIIFFELTSLSNEGVFNGGYYAAMLNGRIPVRVKLAVGICTFKREEFVTATLSRLSSSINNSDSILYNSVKVFVSDNGQSLPVEQLEDDNIHIVYNKNLGGAGGFTRCLVEALKVDDKEQFTNFLFLDDDIILSVYAIERNVTFLSMLLPQYRKSVIGGAMFSTDDKYLQFESAAKWQRTGFLFNRRDIDMRDNINILLNEQDYDVNYNAWCYCCIPFEVVTKNNLPLPIFFHMDDVEYGLRNNLPIITLNGINVWHLYKKALVNAKNDYYDIRNRLIMLSEINPSAVIELAYIYLNSFTKEVLKYHYARAINAFDAILDFCKGFEWFKKLDTLKKHSQLFNNVKWVTTDDDVSKQAVVSIPDFTNMSERRFKLKIALNQIFSLKNNPTVVYNENSASDTFNTKKVKVYVKKEKQVITYKRNLRLAVKCFIKHYKVAHALKGRLQVATKEFNHRITELQNEFFWSKYLELPYELQKPKKKVLFVASDNDSTSGAFRSMVALCSILQNSYMLDICILLPNDGDGVNLIRAAGLKYTIIDSKDWIVKLSDSQKSRKIKRHDLKKVNKSAVKKITKFIREEGFDLIHINTSYSYVGAIAAHRTGVPIVWHIREFLEEDQQREIINKRYGYSLMNTSSRIVAISQSILKKYNKIFGDKISLIYNGIDDKQFYLSQKKIFQSSKIIFICVGAITEYKGQLIAVKAIEKLKRIDNLENFELWLVGTDKGEYANTIRSFIDQNGLSNNVKILGRRSDVNNLYMQSDIAFVCSKAEAFGRITVEAMMSGNLVIGADTAGTKEIIVDGVDGLLFKSGDFNSLYEKIKFALENKTQAIELALHGQHSAIKKFTADRNAKEVYELYQGIWEQEQNENLCSYNNV